MRQAGGANHPSAALRQTIKTAFCPLSRGCSESGFWPHVWLQTDAEYVETVEVRVAKSVRNKAKTAIKRRKKQKKIYSKVWEQDAGNSSLPSRAKMCWRKMQRRKRRMKVRRFHIFIATFQFKKLGKQDFSDNEFLAATGDILEMQPVVFMNWCDSNARA